MLYIKKSTDIPQEIIDALNMAKESYKERLANGDSKAVRNAFNDLQVRDDIRKCLIQEQHGLCAYCMQDIHKKARIEHWKSLSNNTKDALEYANMLGVCYGGEISEEPVEEIDGKDKRVLCCDSSKGDKKITLNPCNIEHINKIRYNQKDLSIYTEPRDELLEHDINDVLHLNGVKRDNGVYLDTRTNLVHYRRETYKSYNAYIENLRQMYTTPKELYMAIQKKITSIENAEIYTPFAGVLLYFLKRDLRLYERQMNRSNSCIHS